MGTTTYKKYFYKVSGKHVWIIRNIKNDKVKLLEDIWGPKVLLKY